MKTKNQKGEYWGSQVLEPGITQVSTSSCLDKAPNPPLPPEKLPKSGNSSRSEAVISQEEDSLNSLDQNPSPACGQRWLGLERPWEGRASIADNRSWKKAPGHPHPRPGREGPGPLYLIASYPGGCSHF